ncbi:hypothetical protein [Nonomuraea wenchangensis]|uniref:hypothetical protein n=1 Tax=Nonomuraea wenchangensis TaxID=568860 RepID=UPI0033F3005F
MGTTIPANRPAIGWRAWVLGDDGRLLSVHDSSVHGRWTRPGGMAATCMPSRRTPQMPEPHTSPDKTCHCGLRAMNLEPLLYALVDQPELIGTRPDRWTDPGRWADLDELEWRTRNNVLYMPDVIGTCEMWGRFEAGRWFDPDGTYRFQYGRVGKTLHLGAHVASWAKAVKHWHRGARVHVGRSLGAAWLDEIATVERLPSHTGATP